MIRKSLILILAFLLLPGLVWAQNNEPSPTETTLQTANRLFNAGADLSDAGEYTDAIPVLENALQLAQQVADQSLETQILNSIGFAYSNLGENVLALDYYQKALDIQRQTGNREGEAFTLLNIGVAYFNRDDFQNSMTTFKEALTVHREIGNLQLQSISLNYMAEIYTKYEAYREAGTARLELLELQKVRKDQNGMLRNLFSISQLFETQSDYEEALEYYNQTFELAQELQLSLEMGVILDRMGNLYYTLGKYKEATVYFTQGLDIWRAADNKSNQLEDLLILGRLARIQNQYDQAVILYDQAIDIAKTIEDDERARTALIGLANVYYSQGKLTLSLETYKQALNDAELAEDLIGQGVILGNLSSIYINQMRYDDALSALNQALAIAQETDNIQFIVPILSRLGGLYTTMGNRPRALEYYQSALDLAYEANDQLLLPSVLNELANLYSGLGQYKVASDYLTQVINITRQSGDRELEITAINNLGANYAREGNDDAAIQLFEESLNRFRSQKELDGQRQMLYQMANIYSSSGEYEQAINNFNEALTLAQNLGNKLDEANIFFALGRTYVRISISNSSPDMGMTIDDIKAYEYFTNALNIYESNNSLVDMALVYIERGRISEDPFGNNKELTINNYQSAIAIIEEIINDASLDSTIAHLKDQFWVTEPYIRLGLNQIRGNFQTLNLDLANALNYLERGRAILTRIKLTTQNIDFSSTVESDLLLKEQELRSHVNQAQIHLSNILSSQNSSDASIQEAQQALNEARTSYQQHNETIQLQGGLLSQSITFTAAKLSDIQSALPSDTTLIIYTLPSSFNMVYIITRDEISWGRLRDLEDSPQSLQQLVVQLRESGYSDTQTLEQLYRLLVAPIAEQLKTSRIIISPEGPLNYVPFAALKASDGSYLIDKYAISTIPSGTVLTLLENRKPSAAFNPALVLAQPVAPGLSNLGFAPNEAMSVASILDVQANIDATEADLRTNVKGSPLLVISAHASLNPSIIYLGGTANNTSSDFDGYLEVREIYGLDLSSTQLVVLSGCDTAAGGSGEDFGMLTRAFMAAGAQQVVASLWKVEDQATADLITAFIKEWQITDNAADALRIAMISTKAKYPEPYKWASFVLVGQPDQVPLLNMN